jgi:ParB/RepB/Spo0J family partition protein
MATVLEIPISALRPRNDQPRQHFDEKDLAELAQSIMANGVLSPLTVRPVSGGFEVLGGHRRLRAATLAGQSNVPCVVREVDDNTAEEIVLLDNLGRVDMLPWEEGAGYVALTAKGHTVETLAAKTGKSQKHIQDRIVLHVNLGDRAKEAYLAKELTLGALLQVAALPDQWMNILVCVYCGKPNPEQLTNCRHCQGALPEIPHAGNPQHRAVKLCAGMSVQEATRLCKLVATAYCLDRPGLQQGLSLGELRVKLTSVESRHKIAVLLANVTEIADRLLQHPEELSDIPKEQKDAILAQAQEAHKTLSRLEAQIRNGS